MNRLLQIAVTIGAAVFFGACVCQPARSDLIINLVNGGGTAPATTGTGTLGSVMRSAADVWQLAFNDPSYSHSVSITYQWSGLSTGTLAVHSLLGQGGTPNRETSGRIQFDNDGSSAFFLDGSLDPLNPIANGNSEYSTYTETSQNFGGGLLNKGRVFTGASGDALNRIDLFSVAMHEIGHALGLSSSNTSYAAETTLDNDIDVLAPFLFSGSQLPTTNSGQSLNAHLNISTALMYPTFSSSIRRLPSAADILANAQLSQFFNPNLNLISVPEPALVWLMAFSLPCWLGCVRRR